MAAPEPTQKPPSGQPGRRRFIGQTGLLVAGLSSAGLRQALASPTHTPRRRRRITADHAQLVTTLAELIIPRTDSPGAIDADVPGFMRAVLERWYTDTEFMVFIEGLASLDREAVQHHGCTFVHCLETQQIAVLQTSETKARDWHRAHPEIVSADSLIGKTPIDEHTPFFTRLKELVTVGYYTSEIGAQASMVYLPIPMRYSGEASLAESAGKAYVW